MGVHVGDRITMVGSDIHKQNRQRTMTVIGIYDIGMPSHRKDRRSTSRLAEAQTLFGLRGQSTEVQINLNDVGKEAGVVAALDPRHARLRGRNHGIRIIPSWPRPSHPRTS